jgi:hypothetical protein
MVGSQRRPIGHHRFGLRAAERLLADRRVGVAHASPAPIPGCDLVGVSLDPGTVSRVLRIGAHGASATPDGYDIGCLKDAFRYPPKPRYLDFVCAGIDK